MAYRGERLHREVAQIQRPHVYQCPSWFYFVGCVGYRHKCFLSLFLSLVTFNFGSYTVLIMRHGSLRLTSKPIALCLAPK